MVLSANITKGEKRDLEGKVLELETQKDTVEKRIKELDIQNILLAEKLKVANEKHPYIAPFRNQASLLQNEINQILLK